MLVEVGERGWFLITRDFQLRRRPAEAEARRRAGLGVFILRGPRLTREGIAAALVAALPKMSSTSRAQQRPFVYYVSPSGELRQIEGEGRRGGRKKKRER